MLKWNLQHQPGGAIDQAAALGGRTGWLEIQIKENSFDSLFIYKHTSDQL